MVQTDLPVGRQLDVVISDHTERMCFCLDIKSDTDFDGSLNISCVSGKKILLHTIIIHRSPYISSYDKNIY